MRARLELDAAESALLDQIDGRSPLRALVDRGGRSTFEVFHAVFRLQQVGLVVAEDGTEAPAGVLVCDGDVDGIQRPLAELCAALGERLAVVADHGAVVATVRRAPPKLVLVAAAGTETVAALAARLAAEAADAGTAVVALLDAGDEDRVAACIGAGCVAALVKPFARRDLAAVLAAHVRPVGAPVAVEAAAPTGPALNGSARPRGELVLQSIPA
jgi:CheY-like chemotaxis protein